MAARRFSRFPVFVALFLTAALLWRGFPPPEPSASLKFVNRPKIQFSPSSFDWSSAPEFNPVSSLASLPKGKPKKFARVQHKFSSKTKDKVTEQRRKAVRDVFLRSWRAYKDQAWGYDELVPVTGGGKNTFCGWAATLVDALDTMWIMELYDEFYDAAGFAARLDWANTSDTSANMFETTIRHLGGLLSAYDLSGEPALLEKAKELGNMLYMGFDTPTRMPGFWLSWKDAREGKQTAGTHDPSASPASLSLEFTRLAQLTGNDKYYDAIERVRQFLARTQEDSKLPGMWPRNIDFRNFGVQSDNTFTLGALADSLYEYLPKMFILTGGLEPSYEAMYKRAMEVATEHILFRPMLPGKEDILFSGTTYVRGEEIEHAAEGQHLACFVGGMYLLGGKTFGIEEHIGIGERVTRGCSWAYDAFPTGLMPEIFDMVKCPSKEPCEWDTDRWAKEGSSTHPKGFKNARDSKYILRPEAIESVFYLYRVTGQEELRDIAWRMFQSVIKSTETEFAYSAISDVTTDKETSKQNSMEVSAFGMHEFMALSNLLLQSFWMAETLKYFYLIFCPEDVISLDEWVFNTEAHPLRRPR